MSRWSRSTRRLPPIPPGDPAGRRRLAGERLRRRDVLQPDLAAGDQPPASSVISTCQSCWVRPRWTGVPTAVSSPSRTARRKSVWLDTPDHPAPVGEPHRARRRWPRSPPPSEYTPPCWMPYGWCSSGRTCQRITTRSGPASSNSSPSRATNPPVSRASPPRPPSERSFADSASLAARPARDPKPGTGRRRARWGRIGTVTDQQPLSRTATRLPPVALPDPPCSTTCGGGA